MFETPSYSNMKLSGPIPHSRLLQSRLLHEKTPKPTRIYTPIYTHTLTQTHRNPNMQCTLVCRARIRSCGTKVGTFWCVSKLTARVDRFIDANKVYYRLYLPVLERVTFKIIAEKYSKLMDQPDQSYMYGYKFLSGLLFVCKGPRNTKTNRDI